ncbi:MAG: SDR family NAD(P)-dependent oxidoreductase [Devosia nanyangense]|nr:SDR family NAD(P)-dependent oxidoreductase [Devosia nanyangense]
MNLKPGIAWIIGGGSGIGAAVARELAGRGWQVAISGRRLERLEEVAASHSGIHAYPLDITDAEAVAATVAAIAADFGRIDLLLYGAVAATGTPPGSYDAARFAAAFDINVMGLVRLLDPVITQMSRQPTGGQIAVISSLAGYVGLPRGGAYAATKSALITLCQTMRVELEPKRIIVRLITPGFVKSELTARNRYRMPMLMETEDAAWRIVDGLVRSTRFEIAFPWPMVFVMKAARLLPYRLFFWLSALTLRAR